MSKTNIDTIQEHLDQDELLAQLAEEAAELAQAALKLRRVYTGLNPTPVNRKEAFNNLLEEIGDVYTCITVLSLDRAENMKAIQRSLILKLERWAARLEANT